MKLWIVLKTCVDDVEYIGVAASQETAKKLVGSARVWREVAHSTELISKIDDQSDYYIFSDDVAE